MVRAVVRPLFVRASLVSVLALAAFSGAAVAAKPRHAKATKSSRKESRVPTRSTATNMPPGWTWPPSRHMEESGQACEAKLDDLAVSWEPTASEGHVVAPIRVPEMQLGGVTYTSLFRQGPFVMDCELALALETYGEQLRALGVREVKFGRIYGWTKVRVGGKTKNMLSRHALGLAMDIVSIVDEDGREAVVARDYNRDDELLLGVEKVLNASGGFRTVLTPKNDPISHRDHFHIEARVDFTPPPSEQPSS
jgi:hypothetical protein